MIIISWIELNHPHFRYLILQPILRIVTKPPTAAMQTVLHALFLPTPFKILSRPTNKTKTTAKGTPIDASLTEMPEEILKPGALYAECAVVRLNIPTPANPLVSEDKKEKGKGKAEVLEIPDDGEFGGEVTGRLVWEAYEEALKVWEKANPPKEEESTAAAAPDVDRDGG